MSASTTKITEMEPKKTLDGTEHTIAKLVQDKSRKFYRPLYPIWLIHHRYRYMDRKARSDLMAREAQEREQMLSERQSQRHQTWSDAAETAAQQSDPNPWAYIVAEDWPPNEDRDLESANNEGADEEIHLQGADGHEIVPGEEEVVSVNGRRYLIFPTRLSTLAQPQLPTLLIYYKNLEAYQKFPLHTFSRDPILVDPEAYESIIRELECPVCTNTCFPPYSACRNSHLICTDCKIRIFDKPKHLPELLGVTSPTCPTCRDTRSMDFQLSGTLGAAISAIDFKCLYHEMGCTQILNGMNYQKHVKEECVYRTWKCPYCTQLLGLTTAAKHWISVHEHSNLGYSKLLYDLPTACDLSVPMRGEELETCFGLFHVQKVEKTFALFQIRTGVLEYAWFICLFGTPEESRAFRVDVTLVTHYDMGFRIHRESRTREWKDIQVFSCQNEMRDIIENVGLMYTDTQMPFNNFCYPGGRAERFEASMNLAFRKWTQ